MNNYRRSGLFGGFSIFPPVIKYLLFINVGVFILEHFFLDMLMLGDKNLGYLFVKLFSLQPIFPSPIKSPISGPFLPWQLITYMFLHGGFTHLFFNMFALWMFGMELENLWGSKKFLIYYTICGLGAGIANLFIAPLFSTPAPTVGASGSIYGILVAFGYIFPNRYIYIYFMIPIKAKILVILYMALEVYSVASQADTGIAHIAHLGGAVVGFIYLIFTSKKTIRIFDSFKRTKDNYYSDYYKNVNTERKYYDATYEDIGKDEYKNEIDLRNKEIQERLDKILDKLSKSGYQSLTEEEKKILFQDSKRLK